MMFIVATGISQFRERILGWISLWSVLTGSSCFEMVGNIVLIRLPIISSTGPNTTAATGVTRKVTNGIDVSGSLKILFAICTPFSTWPLDCAWGGLCKSKYISVFCELPSAELSTIATHQFLWHTLTCEHVLQLLYHCERGHAWASVLCSANHSLQPRDNHVSWMSVRPQ